jgi:hypothetical protein
MFPLSPCVAYTLAPWANTHAVSIAKHGPLYSVRKRRRYKPARIELFLLAD